MFAHIVRFRRRRKRLVQLTSTAAGGNLTPHNNWGYEHDRDF
jgi:hypothetical protein